MQMNMYEHRFEKQFNIGPDVTSISTCSLEYILLEHELMETGLVGRIQLLHQFNQPPYDAILWLSRPDISARIVGRNGSVVNDIKMITKTEIWSPRLASKNGFRNQKDNDGYFKISGPRPLNTLLAIWTIVQTGFDFFLQFVTSITPPPKSIREEFQVNADLVPKLLKNRGEHVILIKEICSVKIVSPKPYAPPCIFYIIGLPMNVFIAKLLMYQLVDEIQPLPLKYRLI